LLGLRPTQEDRFILIPEFYHPAIALAGVFDGTVGDHASHFASRNFPPHLSANKNIQELVQITQRSDAPSGDHAANLIKNALHETFHSVDEALLAYCRDERLHYASSTGVVAFLWNQLLTVAHVGDSKACIAKVGPEGDIHPEWLTMDHKPDQPAELARIEAAGGSLVWLHGNKPFLRGGDFLRRQALGEHPKQLNYSRAFGGKDLKNYGLIVTPDVNHFEIQHDDKLVILASDGLWDVLSPRVACEIAINQQRKGGSISPSRAVAEYAIRQMPNVNIRDNITVIVIFL
jgi:serine/threonine protein phosphatase PrpC